MNYSIFERVFPHDATETLDDVLPEIYRDPELLKQKDEREDVLGNELFKHAAAKLNEKLVTFLLNHGYDIDWDDCEGYTALTWHVWEDDLDAIKFLVKHQANPDHPKYEKMGFRPLSIASFQQKNDIVKFLLVQGTDPNGYDLDQMTPLSAAVQSNNLTGVILVLEHGGDPLWADSYGQRAIDWADEETNPQIVQCLREAMGKTD
jgi:ankyrin repeat protein